MAITFKTAVKKAKGLYKSGNYKSFSAAVKAAFKKGGGAKVRQTGTSTRKADAKRKAKAPGKRRSKSGNTYSEYRKNRSDKPGKLTGTIREAHSTPLAKAKHRLAKALLDYELADTFRATKEAQKRKVRYRKQLKALL